MTTVRIAHADPRPGKLPNGGFDTRGFLVVLADDAGHRAVPIWMQAEPGDGDLSQLLELAARPAGEIVTTDVPQELTARLLGAAGASVTAVDIDELGPAVTAARIALASPAGTQRVTARLPEGLAVAITTGAPVRVADQVMDRLAVSAGQGPVRLPEPTAALAAVSLDPRRRYEPRNLGFADGLHGWQLGGSFTEHASHSHWQDYSCAAEHGTAKLSSTVPQPAGFAFLAQEMYADDYRGAKVTFRAEFRTADTAGTANRAGLFLRANREWDIRGPLTERAVLADPNNTIVPIAAERDWTSHEATARIPGDADLLVFGIFLAGPGQIELRHPTLTRV